MNHERIFLGSCFLEPSLIDQAVHDGLKDTDFDLPDRRTIWLSILGLRTNGKVVDVQAVYLDLGKGCPAPELFACEEAAPTHAHGKGALQAMIETSTLRRLRFAVGEVQDKLAKGAGYESVKSSLEAIPALLRPSEASEHTLPEIVSEAAKWAQEQIEGSVSDEKVVLTGFPDFDSKATPIQMHEYVVLGARTSTGKSSMMAQIAGHNLNRGLRVAYFTLETSARAVVLQIAAQRASCNLRLLRSEMPARQKALTDEIAKLGKQPFIVFEKDLSLEQIESRCRLLATSWKPDLVIIDYLGLIRVKADGGYERMSKLSKAAIPLRKALGCTLFVAAQLNRGNEKEDRAPTRTDFRDSGSLEEDASRVLILHRPSKDDSGIPQGYDRNIYLSELYQAKHREGPLTQTRLDFFSGHTKFVEKQ